MYLFARVLFVYFQKKGTYLVHYGRWKVFAIILVTIGAGVVAGRDLGLHRLLLPVQLGLAAVRQWRGGGGGCLVGLERGDGLGGGGGSTLLLRKRSSFIMC